MPEIFRSERCFYRFVETVKIVRHIYITRPGIEQARRRRVRNLSWNPNDSGTTRRNRGDGTIRKVLIGREPPISDQLNFSATDSRMRRVSE